MQQQRVLVCSPIFPRLQINERIEEPHWNVAGTLRTSKQFSRLWNFLTGREKKEMVCFSAWQCAVNRIYRM